MGIRPERHAKGPGQAKVSEFKIEMLVDEKILWFEVSVENAVCMTIVETRCQLMCEFLLRSGEP